MASVARSTTSRTIAGRRPRPSAWPSWSIGAPTLPRCRRTGAAPSRRTRRGDPSYHLKQEDFDAVIDGMAMDAEHDIRAPDWETLDLYCDRVASAVGRLSVRIFGLADDPGVALAYHLGRALQLTNILRDIDEDASKGRLYLPREALAAAGVTSDEPLAAAADPKLASLRRSGGARSPAFRKAQSIMARRRDRRSKRRD